LERLTPKQRRAWKPTPKVAVGTYNGALSVLTIWILHEFGVEVPAEVASALTLLFMSTGAYLKRDKMI